MKKKIKFYEIFKKDYAFDDKGRVGTLFGFVENENVAKAICKNNERFFYSEVEEEIEVDENEHQSLF